jgi:hypothetical protein
MEAAEQWEPDDARVSRPIGPSNWLSLAVSALSATFTYAAKPPAVHNVP